MTLPGDALDSLTIWHSAMLNTFHRLESVGVLAYLRLFHGVGPAIHVLGDVESISRAPSKTNKGGIASDQ
jgi:hypothetical protein